jgi:flavin reductase (DIM6/NTAB) family NADH-FMN oxidoreductase RutF
MPIVCVTSAYEEKRNVMTAAWCAPASFYPALITISIGITRYTHDLVMKSREFVLNVMAFDQRDIAVYCGNNSGRDGDKFSFLNLEIKPGQMVKAPLIAGTAANIECQVLSYHSVGDHTLFVGETVAYEEDIGKKPLIRFRGEFFTLSDFSLGADDHTAKV